MKFRTLFSRSYFSNRGFTAPRLVKIGSWQGRWAKKKNFTPVVYMYKAQVLPRVHKQIYSILMVLNSHGEGSWGPGGANE